MTAVGRLADEDKDLNLTSSTAEVTAHVGQQRKVPFRFNTSMASRT